MLEKGKLRKDKKDMPEETEPTLQSVVDHVAAMSQSMTQMVASINAVATKLTQTQAQTTGASQVSSQERMGDVGGTENIESELVHDLANMRWNKKRTGDEYQEASLKRIGYGQDAYATMVSHAQDHYDALAKISEQIMVNMAGSSNQTNNQSINHRDIAVTEQWGTITPNLAELQLLKNAEFMNAVTAAVATTLAEKS